MTKKEELTNEMLDDIYKKLCEAGSKPGYDEDGRPVCSIEFHGTKDEVEKIQKRLLELTPEQP